MSESENSSRQSGLAAAPRWFTPAAVTTALGIVAALVVLNVATLVIGEDQPWLRATDAVADLVVLAAGAALFVRLGLSVGAETTRMRVALDDATTRLGAIVETAMDPIITIDDAQRIVLFNRAAEQAFGCAREAAIGVPLERFVPARFRDAHRGHAGDRCRREDGASVLAG